MGRPILSRRTRRTKRKAAHEKQENATNDFGSQIRKQHGCCFYPNSCPSAYFTGSGGGKVFGTSKRRLSVWLTQAVNSGLRPCLANSNCRRAARGIRLIRDLITSSIGFSLWSSTIAERCFSRGSGMRVSNQDFLWNASVSSGNAWRRRCSSSRRAWPHWRRSAPMSAGPLQILPALPFPARP